MLMFNHSEKEDSLSRNRPQSSPTRLLDISSNPGISFAVTARFLVGSLAHRSGPGTASVEQGQIIPDKPGHFPLLLSNLPVRCVKI